MHAACCLQKWCDKCLFELHLHKRLLTMRKRLCNEDFVAVRTHDCQEKNVAVLRQNVEPRAACGNLMQVGIAKLGFGCLSDVLRAARWSSATVLALSIFLQIFSWSAWATLMNPTNLMNPWLY